LTSPLPVWLGVVSFWLMMFVFQPGTGWKTTAVKPGGNSMSTFVT
jgi:hypothetical protein